VLAYFKPLSDTRLKNDAETIENRFAGQRDVKLGGLALTNAQGNAQAWVGSSWGSEPILRPCVGSS
jgi:hypothetical protein